ncbi:MAG: histidine--tRNA ligase [Defluviitaleaceae bacterium]|nr:histidine--tRNA ligase [Defluviitaleaceae bacterium]
MDKIQTKVLSGFMELLPQEQVEFDRIKGIIADTFRSFGFAAIDTPVIERSEILLTKGGAETDKQVYFVQNGMTAKEPNALAMRFDLTIPLARYVAEHFGKLVFPFRRMHIGKVYRGERAQKGRFREFYQCDIDVIGRNELSIYYDAELPFVIYQLFRALDLGKFTIRLNNRKVLNGLFSALNIAAASADILRIIDKAEKISAEDLLKSFADAGLDKKQTDSILAFMNIKGDVAQVLADLENLGIDNEIFALGVAELGRVAEIMGQMGIDPAYFAIDLSIARGLDYYTSTVYETILDDSPNIGSVCSGGRYDNLAEHYTKEKLPGVGISIGLTRLFDQLRENGLLKDTKKSVADVVVIAESGEYMPHAYAIANALRDAGKNVDVFYEDINMKKKFQYISKKDAPYTVVCRGDEGGMAVYSLQYKVGEDFRKEVLPITDIVMRVL